MEIVALNEVDSTLKAVIDRVSNNEDYTILQSPDSEDAVIMSVQYFNSLMETAYLLSSSANASHLQKSIAQHKSGQVFERDLIED